MSVVLAPSTKRKPVQRRTKGERTREKILISAIEILAKHGIKGTTHRAIASHANIQLSLTTYYFKDIQALVRQAFQLNADIIQARTAVVLQKIFSALDNIQKSNLRKVSVKTELCEQLSTMTANYLFAEIKNETSSLAVEQLMYTAAQVTPALKSIADQHEKSELRPYTQLVNYFNKNDPEVDAKIMRILLSQIAYSQLFLAENERSIEPIIKMTKKIMSWIMGLKN